ncbi:MAG: hypothetical protein [Bacteriophage sp.]|nr:MAG: hypothetical protein [Bacteriophage sp.]
MDVIQTGFIDSTTKGKEQNE